MFRKSDQTQHTRNVVSVLLQQLRYEFPDLDLRAVTQHTGQAEDAGQAIASALRAYIQQITSLKDAENQQTVRQLKQHASEIEAASKIQETLEQTNKKLTRELSEARAEISDLKDTVYRQRIQLAQQHEQIQKLLGK
ncbi:MAG TPA: hypothetical protein PLT26_12875 [Anaerolineaceae bacterium]|nr:hypothetical protein [Anaerolineaceae bacterium]